MNRFLPALVLTLACAPRYPVGPVPVDEAAKPVTLVELPDSSSPNVYLQATVHAGSAWDPTGKEGLAHLVANSLVDAGAGDRSAPEVREALYITGNDMQVVVGREMVSLRLRCHIDHQALCAEVFLDTLTQPRFDTADVERLREDAHYRVSEGLLGDTEAMGEEAFNALIWSAHPYGHPVQGLAGSLETLDADDVRGFYAEHYLRGTVTVGLAGNWQPETSQSLTVGLERLSGTLPPELPLLQPEPLEGRTLMAVDTDTAVTGVHFGHPIRLGRDDADYPALVVAMTALGAHRQSFGRLFRTLRTTRGLNYGTYAYVEPYVQRGWSSMPQQGVWRRQSHFYVWIRPTSLENGPFALRLALAEVDRLIDDGLESEEFEDTRSYLQGWIPLLAQDPGQRLAFELEARATGMPNFLDLVQHLPNLDRAEVNAASPDTSRPVIWPSSL